MYLLVILKFSSGIYYDKNKKNDNFHPFISVIVAARNEEHSLPKLLKALSSQTYPKEKYEVIIVDDRSTDSTSAVVDNFKNDLSKVENNIHMTKNQSRQDPLNYGIRINNRIAFLLADSQRGDYPPTNQAKAFFKEITAELDREMEALEKLLNVSISKLNEIVSDNQIGIFSMKSP